MTEFHVTVKDLDKAVARLRLVKEAARQEFQAAMTEATAPMIKAIRANAVATLPRAGGLGRVIAASRFTVSPIRGKGLAGVRVATDDHDPRIDKGRLRHPVYGRGRWVVQSVTAGWFTRGARRATGATRAAIRAASAGLARRLG